MAKNLAYAKCRIMKFHYRNSSNTQRLFSLDIPPRWINLVFLYFDQGQWHTAEHIFFLSTAHMLKAAPVLTHMEPEGWACGRHKLPRCRSFLFYPNYCNNLVLLNSNHRPWHTAARILFLSTAHVLKRFPFYVINPNFFIITFVIATRGSKGWYSSS